MFFHTERLKFSPPLEDKCVPFDEVTNISCNAGGSNDPNPTVKWTKVNTDIGKILVSGISSQLYPFLRSIK